MRCLVNQKLTATDTDTVKNVDNIREELDEIYGTGELKMSKMAGT
jgi:hypothetical protein